jgi:putative endopeptidase
MVAKLNMKGIFSVHILYAGQDDKNSERVIANGMQGGLSLPDRDYYTNDDPRTIEIQGEYLNYIQKMLTMLGDTEEEAAKKSKSVLSFETRLAKASMTLKERRNPDSVYNLMSKDEFLASMLNYDFNAYITALGIENIEVINIHQPKFFAEVDKMATEVPLEDWKIYLSWKVINGTASLLSSDIEQARFDFFGSKLSGTPKMQERWKRMVGAINGNLGEAMGKLYVEKYFPQEAKDRMMELVGNLKIALESSIKNLDWMSEVTKTKALEKLNTMRVKVGYPNKWKDYSSVDISPDNYVQNSWNCDAFGYRENLDKIGKPVDREEWGMTPQTVNAYYSPNMNEIVFPAAILQPPFFDLHADDAVNYGAIGVVIGHEMTHGFDDQGCKYDKDGNLNDWWTEADAENFKEKVQILIDQYNAYSMLDSLHIDGHLTLGENIADNGGLYIAHAALMQSYEKNGTPEDIDSLNYNQRFFISYAQVWRQNIRDKELMRRLKEDVHSPGEARVNAGVANLPWWYEAFNITPENKFYIAPEERAKSGNYQ